MEDLKIKKTSIDRRYFLKQSAAASGVVAAPAPASMHGIDGPWENGYIELFTSRMGNELLNGGNTLRNI